MPTKKNFQAFIMDALQQFLTAASTITTGTLVIIGAFIDLKGLGFAQGTIIIDVSAIDTGDADEVYTVDVQLGTDDAGYVSIAAVPLTAVGRLHIPFDNQHGQMYNSLRLMSTVSGTTPSITIDNAFLTDKIS